MSAHSGLTAAVFSNGHNVVLAAATRPAEVPRGILLLNSAARKSLAQNTACAPARAAPRVPANAGLGVESLSAALVCTAFML